MMTSPLLDPMEDDQSAPPRPRILVIDDEKNIRTMLALCLEQIGSATAEAGSADAALDAVRRNPYDIAFLDLRLGSADGLHVLTELLAEQPDLSVVIITAYATIETAVEAMKRGATDYLPKPFTPPEIRHVVERIMSRRTIEHRLADLEGQLRHAVPDIDLETRSPAMRAALETLRRAAPSDAAVLLRGESGTGKSVLARAVHALSPRRDHPFVVVSCPTLSEELLTSELFGHAQGAFTGATRDQPGRVEAAQGGTLFLDEIAEISPSLQVKLLRFLQEKEFERVGETRVRHADVRVIAATNLDLNEAVRAGRFREDLLYRLNVIEVTVPALRERIDDIERLARGFVSFFARSVRRPTPELPAATVQALINYPWPGNVRELRNAIERAVILWPGAVLQPNAFGERIAAHAAETPRLGGNCTLESIEREHILQVIAHTATLDDAARILDIDASTLWRKRKKYES
jgi:NtrC-family two-component system response regulator AlgB